MKNRIETTIHLLFPSSTIWGYFFLRFIYQYLLPLYTSLKSLFLYVFRFGNIVDIPFSSLPLTISLINSCNAKCVFCNYRKLRDPKNIMSMDTLRKGIDEFVCIGGKSVILIPTVGEVTLDSGLFDKIAYIHSFGLDITLYTNGLLLNNERIRKSLVDSGISSLHISIGDIDPLYESQIFGVPLACAKEKLLGLRALLEYNQKTKSIPSICLEFKSQRFPAYILQDPCFDYIKNTHRQFSLQSFFTSTYDNWGGRVSAQDLLGVMKLKMPLFFRKDTCFSMYYRISILGTGDVRLCACRIKDTEFDDLIVGNIHNDSLSHILSSDTVKRLRQSFKKGCVPDVCKKCSFYFPISCYWE